MKNKILVEGNHGNGAKGINPIYRKARNFFKAKVGKEGVPIDWSVSFDVQDSIGKLTVKDQGTSDSCGGNSGAYFIEIQRKLQNLKEGPISAKSIYAPIAFSGGGTTVPYLEHQISVVGSNLEASVSSYNALGQPLTEAMYIETSWETPATTADAFQRAGYTPYDVGTNIDDVASAIKNYGACIAEIRGQNGNSPSWLSSTPQPPSIYNSNPIWAHFVCLLGYKMIDGVKYIVFINSWGEAVGNRGIQMLSEDYFTSGGVVDVFTFIYDSHIEALPLSMPFWQSLLSYFKQFKWLQST